MSQKNVVIVDYHLGNLFSVNQALLNIGLSVTISSDPMVIRKADALVLPGVGAFGDAMRNLQEADLVAPIKEFIAAGKPFLGICLGLQLLFSTSEEFGATEGLDVIKGAVKRFPITGDNNKRIKVPQIAWNQITPSDSAAWIGTPLENIAPGEYMYFVHSYYVVPEETVQLSYTNYENILYTSSVLKNNIFACQFHPEKSAGEGLKIYYNWAFINKLI